MPHAYLLPSPLGHHYYETAQVGAFVVYTALLLGQGYRRGYPARAWLPLVAASTLALVLGCQLACLPLGSWLGWLQGHPLAVQALAEGPRTVVGGAWGVFLVVLVLRRPLGFRGWAVLDAFAAPLCWALAVQSVGCVLAGCCWGEATTSGWGVAYGPGSAAYAAQLALGCLPAGAAHTLPLAPTQLLQLLLCAGAGLVLHWLRRRAWPAGSHYLLGMGLLCAGRLLLEAWRDPASEPLLAASLGVAGFSLRGLQWLMLTELLVLLGGWAWLVRRAAQPAPLPQPAPAAPALVGLALLVAATRLAPSTLSLAETATLQLLLLLVLLAEGRTWLAVLGREVPRLARLPLAALTGAFLLLATAQAPAPQRADSASVASSKALIFSGGFLGSNHDAESRFSSGGCGGSNTMLLHQQVRAAGGEVAFEKMRPSGSLRQTGVGLWVGQQQIDARTINGSPEYDQSAFTLYDVHAYKEATRGQGWTTWALRLGLHLGDLGHYSYFNADHSKDAVWLMPEGMLRLGNPRLAYFQADAGYGAENALGSYATRLAVGSGLGQAQGSQLLVGYANAAHSPTPSLAFVSANLRLPGRNGPGALGLEPYFATDFGQHHLFSVKLNYRLNR